MKKERARRRSGGQNPEIEASDGFETPVQMFLQIEIIMEHVWIFESIIISGFTGISYGSEIPVNSFTIPFLASL